MGAAMLRLCDGSRVKCAQSCILVVVVARRRPTCLSAGSMRTLVRQLTHWAATTAVSNVCVPCRGQTVNSPYHGAAHDGPPLSSKT